MPPPPTGDLLALACEAGRARRRMPRVCAESSPQRQASWKLEPSQGQAWGPDGGAVAAALVELMKRAARPRHLTAAGSLAPGLPAQLGQATARVRGRGELRQVARRAHCRARPRRLRHPAAAERLLGAGWNCGPVCRGLADQAW